MSLKLTGQCIKERLEDHSNVINDSIDVMYDQVTFRVKNIDQGFPDKFKGCDVMQNECEDYEDEYSIVL